MKKVENINPLVIDISITDIKNQLNLDMIRQYFVSLPYKMYILAIDKINNSKEINKLKKEIKRIEDQLLISINKDKSFNNQAIREAQMRLLLDENAKYNNLTIEFDNLITENNRIDELYSYYDRVLSGLKQIYKERLYILYNDQKLQEQINEV